MLQFLQCKTFGNQAVPAGWVIVAAGNPPEYNKSVRDFDIVTLDRVRRMDIEPDLQVWKDYARTAHIHSAILSYLDLHPQNFYQINADVDGTQFVTARGWRICPTCWTPMNRWACRQMKHSSGSISSTRRSQRTSLPILISIISTVMTTA